MIQTAPKYLHVAEEGKKNDWKRKKKKKSRWKNCSGINCQAGARTLTVHALIHQVEGCVKSVAARCTNLKSNLAALWQTERLCQIWFFFLLLFFFFFFSTEQAIVTNPHAEKGQLSTGQKEPWPCLTDNCGSPELAACPPPPPRLGWTIQDRSGPNILIRLRPRDQFKNEPLRWFCQEELLIIEPSSRGCC